MNLIQNKTSVLTATLIAVSAFCSQASAGLTTHTQSMSDFTYNSDTVSGAFQAALGSGYTHISFDDVTNTDGTSYSPVVTFSTKAGAFGGSNSSLVNASGEIGPVGTWDGILSIDFGSSYVSTIGFGLVEFESSAEQIRLYDSSNTLLGTFNNQLAGTFSLWGVSATAGEQISRVELDGNFFGIQDIEFSAVNGSNKVPDTASTLLTLSLGLFCIGLLKRRTQG